MVTQPNHIIGCANLGTKMNFRLSYCKEDLCNTVDQVVGGAWDPPSFNPALMVFSCTPCPSGFSSVPVLTGLLSLWVTLVLNYRNSGVIFSHEVRGRMWAGYGWRLPYPGILILGESLMGKCRIPA